MKFFSLWKYPVKWNIFRQDDRLLLIFISFFVGLCSGFAALILNRALEAAVEWCHHLKQYWWVFVLPAIGAAFSSIFLEKVIKEGAGHGVPEVVYSVTRYGGILRFRSSFSRLVSSFLTIGSGGSAGPEAPVVMSGASIGSNIARLFSLNDRQRITLVGCGAAGAIASIFNAPIAGMVFALEVIIGEWKSVNIVPIAIASVTGAEVCRILRGNQVIFEHQKFHFGFSDIISSVGLAIVAALLSVLFTRTLRVISGVSKKVPLPIWLRAACGGLVVGGIGIFFPVVLGEGYHHIDSMIMGTLNYGFAAAAFAVILKIFATSMTLGWGGSGGIFAPCLVIGSFTGLAYHSLLLKLMPGFSIAPSGSFALLGMAGIISGVLQAPLTGIFLIVEITGGYEVILPLIIVSSTSTTLCHYIEPASFYLRDLAEKGQLLRPGTDARVLTDIRIRELIEKDCITVTQNMLLRKLVGIVKNSHRNYYPVEDEKTGFFLGLIHLDDIRSFIFNPGMYDAVFIGQLMQTNVKCAKPDDNLQDVLFIMDSNRLYSIPVVSNGKFIGMISKSSLLDHYRKELIVQTSAV